MFYNNDKLLILTDKRGFFELEGDKLKSWDLPQKQMF